MEIQSCFSPGKWLRSLFILFIPAVPVSAVMGQSPAIRADLDFSGRKTAEVNEPGYASWKVEEGKGDSRTYSGVNFRLKGNVHSDWYKAGVQPPVLARLVNDGLVSEGALEMHISGLPAGRHTLLTFHNTFADPLDHTFAPIDIYVNGKLAADNLVPTNRAGASVEAGTAYLNLESNAGQDVILRFEADRGSAASREQVILNGFELNTPDIKAQASRPLPAGRDEHVDASNGLVLTWKAGKDAVSHDLYFGTDSAEVSAAGHASSLYKGNQTAASYPVKGLYSMLTYYWRVDEVDAGGNITRGDVWYFRPRQLAFPGAEGYGRFARGGRGGKVVEVTNLNDSGPGSLRDAVENHTGPRTIVFTVSGHIRLKSRLVVRQPYVTIAGQTAPGKGITISGAPLGLTGDDGIVRFLRVRVGAGRTYDGMGLTGANHSIIDHCSISWTIDEAFSSRGAYNITLQRTLISEALNIAGHSKYEKGEMHGYAASIGGDTGSFHHNLLAHCYGRNWSLAGGVDGNGVYIGRLDIRNNVVYNWGKRSTDGGAHEVNFVNNYYKPGPATVFHYALKAQHEGYGGGTQQYYFKGNVMPGYFDEDNQQEGRMIEGEADYKTYVDTPFFPSYVRTHSAEEAYKQVLSDVGCNQPELDDHDIRIIQETLNGTYKYKGSISGLPGMPDSHQDVGGWEAYPELHRKKDWDSDHDGLPDWWETLHGLNPRSDKGDFSDSNADPDKDGFTHLDDYLDWIAKPHFTADSGEQIKIDLAQLFRGFTGRPVYSISKAKNARVSILADGKTARFEPAAPGQATIEFTVSDASGSSMARTVGVHVRNGKH